MKRWDKDWIFWTIVWTILLFAVLLMLSFGISKAFADDPSVDCLKKLRVYPRSPIVLTEFSAQIPDDPEIKPLEVADPLYGEELYRFYIAQINEQYYPDVDPYIALAVMETESRYNPNVSSPYGAIGLMQVIPGYHAWRAAKYCLNDLWDPYTNIIVGMDLLNDLYQSSGSWSKALFGYNHSQAYVNEVLSRANALRGGGYFG